MNAHNTQAIREKLEEKFTHVTFLKTNKYGELCWTVGENMEQIFVKEDTNPEDALANVELNRLKSGRKGRLSSEKVWFFYECMKSGKIPCDYNEYRKYTEAQVKAIYKG